jgi:serine protease
MQKVFLSLAVVLITASLGAQAPAPATMQTMSAQRAQAFSDAASRQLEYLPGEVIVKFRTGVDTERQSRALGAVRGRPAVRDMEWVGPSVAIVRDATQDPRALAAQLVEQPEVQYAEPNYIYKLPLRSKLGLKALDERDLMFEPRAAVVPNDPGFSARQWNFSSIDMPKAWEIQGGGKSTIIAAVVDTGITTVTQNIVFANWNGTAIVNQSFAFAINPDLSASRLVAPWDFVNNSGVVLDMDGHGTHVSGTIGQETNNNLSGAGMAYNVKIMPVKVCSTYWDVQFARSKAGIPGAAPLNSGGCANSTIAQGIRYAADNGARVINVSLGGESNSQTILDAINYAIGKGAFIAAAGGNEFEEGNPVEYPAANAPTVDGLMSVAATNRSGARAHYSNTGPHIEIAAPGGSSRDQSLGTGYIWQSTLLFTDNDPEVTRSPRFDRYSEIGYQGTSMATPHVVGQAALMMSQGITVPAAIEAIIKKTAKDIGATGKDDSFGSGLIQPRASIFGVGVIK